MIAVCAAWTPRHSSCRSPEARLSFSRKHPVSIQCRIPDGAPLYPVERIRLSLTMIDPTERLKHVERLDTSVAISMKYVSQDGRFCVSVMGFGSLRLFRIKRESQAKISYGFPDFNYHPWATM